MQISVSELKANAGKYVSMVNEQDIFITRNGKMIARLTTAKLDKTVAAQALFGILPSDAELDAAKKERFK